LLIKYQRKFHHRNQKDHRMPIPIYQVDAFTNMPFKGNPAGVCLLDKPVPDDWMQCVAMEMNLSETAFLLPEGEGYRLRWFTPAVEVDLCGHATLASAHVLAEIGQILPGDSARFFSRSGLLTARLLTDGMLELDFPAKPLEAVPAPDGLIEALGVQPVFIGKNVFDYLVEVYTETEVRQANPDMARLKQVPARGVILTSRSDQYDFVSRFFAPQVGVAEDPVTGSAHCCLAPYWAEKLGKSEFQAYQASPRGGELRLTLDGERVLMRGRAVTVFRGELMVNRW
jgi:PhzF family phenazine biosynthesis protein